jgi:hypothetical protein
VEVTMVLQLKYDLRILEVKRIAGKFVAHAPD